MTSGDRLVTKQLTFRIKVASLFVCWGLLRRLSDMTRSTGNNLLTFKFSRYGYNRSKRRGSRTRL